MKHRNFFHLSNVNAITPCQLENAIVCLKFSIERWCNRGVANWSSSCFGLVLVLLLCTVASFGHVLSSFYCKAVSLASCFDHFIIGCWSKKMASVQSCESCGCEVCDVCRKNTGICYDLRCNRFHLAELEEPGYYCKSCLSHLCPEMGRMGRHSSRLSLGNKIYSCYMFVCLLYILFILNV